MNESAERAANREPQAEGEPSVTLLDDGGKAKAVEIDDC
jgi:hypothetical protein